MKRLIAALLIAYASAAQADEPQLLTFSSGTGFFVNREGYALTNYHVIARCATQVSLYGKSMTTAAKIVAVDTEHDLALLKSAFSTSEIASFSSFKQPLRKGAALVVSGFPGQSWQAHEPVTRTATLLDTKGPTGEDRWIQFSDSVQQGNSGGPLFDGAGNVVGVVVAKAELHTYDMAGGTEKVKRSDVAIAWPVVREFLAENRVTYQEGDSGILMSPEDVAEKNRNSIVNVRCRL